MESCGVGRQQKLETPCLEFLGIENFLICLKFSSGVCFLKLCPDVTLLLPFIRKAGELIAPVLVCADSGPEADSVRGRLVRAAGS